jgi:transposase-like protein
MRDVASWAEAEFGDAELGDERRTRRLVRLGAEVARRPSGKVTQACATSASREGAFRLLENDAIGVKPVTDAAARATMRRCQEQSRVYVAIDGTSLSLTDGTGKKGLGAVGAWSKGRRGIHAMTAFAVAEDGRPLGICDQKLWVREQPSKSPARARSTDLAHRETRYWLELLTGAQTAFAQSAPGCDPWFQLDRGADCWPVLAFARDRGLLLTLRAAHDRHVDTQLHSLWATLEQAPIRSRERVHVPAAKPRQKRQRKGGRLVFTMTAPRHRRIAKVTLRSATVPLVLTNPAGGKFTVDTTPYSFAKPTAPPTIAWSGCC